MSINLFLLIGVGLFILLCIFINGVIRYSFGNVAEELLQIKELLPKRRVKRVKKEKEDAQE